MYTLNSAYVNIQIELNHLNFILNLLRIKLNNRNFIFFIFQFFDYFMKNIKEMSGVYLTYIFNKKFIYAYVRICENHQLIKIELKITSYFIDYYENGINN